MFLGIPFTIWTGWLTLAFLLTTLSLGVAVHVFKKNVFNYHKFFAFSTGILALIHATLAYLLWFKGIVI